MMKFIEGSHFIDARLFSWERNHGSAEISDLGPGFRLHQVWSDSADGGFTIINKATRSLRTFVEHSQRHREGELLSTLFVSLNPITGRIDTTHGALWITLFND